MRSKNGSGLTLALAIVLAALWCVPAGAQQLWYGFGGDSQHSGISDQASQSLTSIVWQTPVDLMPQYSGNDLLIHYGSPMVTGLNTLLIPVKTGASNGFRIESRNGATGKLRWSVNSDYILPSHDWTPSFGATITPKSRLYMAGIAGSVYWFNRIDATQTPAPQQVIFYGSA